MDGQEMDSVERYDGLACDVVEEEHDRTVRGACASGWRGYGVRCLDAA